MKSKPKPQFLWKLNISKSSLDGLIASSVLIGQLCVTPVCYVWIRGLYNTCH